MSMLLSNKRTSAVHSLRLHEGRPTTITTAATPRMVFMPLPSFRLLLGLQHPNLATVLLFPQASGVTTSRSVVEAQLYQKRPATSPAMLPIPALLARAVSATVLVVAIATTMADHRDQNSAMFTFILSHKSCWNIYRIITTNGSLRWAWIGPWHCTATGALN